MIYAEHVHNTALLCLPPDFLRQQNDETPVHEDALEADYDFDMSDSKWAGMLLLLIGLAFLQLLILPILKAFNR